MTSQSSKASGAARRPQDSGPAFDRRLLPPMMLGSVLNPVNSSIISVSLVPIGAAFGAPPDQTAWLISALYLATSIGQPVVGRLIDLHGPRRLFLAGSALTGVAGVIGMLAPNFGVLIAARVLLGFGTCSGYPAAMYLIRGEARRTGKDSPQGVLTALAVANQTIAVIGPSLGGLLIGLGGWRTTLAVNVPLALAGLVLGARRLPRTTPALARSSVRPPAPSPSPASDAAQAPVPDASPGTDPDAGTDPVPGTDPDAAPDPGTGPVTGATPDPDASPVTGATSSPDASPVPDATPHPGTAPVPDATPHPGTASVPDATPPPDATPGTDPPPESTRSPAPDPPPVPDPPPAPAGPRRRWAAAAGLDLPGMVLFAGTLIALLLFLMRPAADRWYLLVLTVLLAAGFTVRELRVVEPFIDLRLLRGNLPLVATYARALFGYVVSYAFLYGYTQWMEEGRGLTASQAGLAQLPLFATAIVVSTVTGRRAEVRGKLLVGAGCQLLACAGLLLLGDDSGVWMLLAIALLVGVPQGLNRLALQNSVYHQAQPERMGSSAGLLRTFGYLGAIVASAADGAFLTGRADTGGLHHLAWFMVAIAALFLVTTAADRSLSRIGAARGADPAPSPRP